MASRKYYTFSKRHSYSQSRKVVSAEFYRFKREMEEDSQYETKEKDTRSPEERLKAEVDQINKEWKKRQKK